VIAPHSLRLTVDTLHTFAQDRSNMELFRPSEACKRLGIHRNTLNRYVRKGLIRVSRPTLRCTLISSAEIARFHNANLQPIPGANNRAAA
jgi:excisionase family DNA binding protein